MLKLLSIGNSFSQDAQRYLWGVSHCAGKEIMNVNLYIGGCSLETHANNLIKDLPSYLKEKGGSSTGEYTSIDTMLRCEDWDAVTLQQASHFSFDYDTYEPHINILADRIRELCPKAKILIHQTWAYEDTSEKLALMGFSSRKDMLSPIKASYDKAFEAIKADGLIPSGQMLDILADQGFKVHRDTFHASLGLGRYALSLLWMKALFGKDASAETFDSFDVEVSPKERRAAEDAASVSFIKYGKGIL